jgi:hypothetical protein
MEKRVFDLPHDLPTLITRTTYGLSYDRQLAETDVLVVDRQFHYIAKELKIEINSGSCDLHIINDQIALIYSIAIDERNNLFSEDDEVIIRIIKERISVLQSKIEQYFGFVEDDNETSAQELLSQLNNKKAFMELVNNENKQARIQLVKNTGNSANAVRDIDIYSEHSDILFENYQLFGIINQTAEKMTLKIQHPEIRKPITMTCNANFLANNGHYDRLHSLKSSGEVTSFRCRALHGELTDIYSDYQLVELVE